MLEEESSKQKQTPPSGKHKAPKGPVKILMKFKLTSH